MSLKRLKQEIDDAHTHRDDARRTLIHIRLALMEISEYLEIQSSKESAKDE